VASWVRDSALFGAPAQLAQIFRGLPIVVGVRLATMSSSRTRGEYSRTHPSSPRFGFGGAWQERGQLGKARSVKGLSGLPHSGYQVVDLLYGRILGLAVIAQVAYVRQVLNKTPLRNIGDVCLLQRIIEIGDDR